MGINTLRPVAQGSPDDDNEAARQVVEKAEAVIAEIINPGESAPDSGRVHPDYYSTEAKGEIGGRGFDIADLGGAALRASGTPGVHTGRIMPRAPQGPKYSGYVLRQHDPNNNPRL